MVKNIFILQVNLAEEFDILQIVGEGWFGKILLVEHKVTDTEMVLKALPKPYVSIKVSKKITSSMEYCEINGGSSIKCYLLNVMNIYTR